MDSTDIDVRGLACPEPLLAFTKAIADSNVGKVVIRFDCGAAKDNISRAAASSGWLVEDVQEAPDHTVMILTRRS